jgi:hypothetical protein
LVRELQPLIFQVNQAPSETNGQQYVHRHSRALYIVFPNVSWVTQSSMTSVVFESWPRWQVGILNPLMLGEQSMVVLVSLRSMRAHNAALILKEHVMSGVPLLRSAHRHPCAAAGGVSVVGC